MEKNYDVFLSHSSQDKEWVIKLKDDLTLYDINAWLDKDEIRPGEVFVQALENAIEHCKTIVLVISRQSTHSKWVQEEYARAVSLEKQKGISFIPVILETAELPSFLSSRNYVDFRDESKYQENVWRLVWGITGKKPYTVIDLKNPDNRKSSSFPVDKKIGSKLNTTRAIYPLQSKVLDGVRDTIAFRGLDNDEWSNTIAEQYFLVAIAHMIGLTTQADYKNLLNKFLRNFHFRLDGGVMLEPVRLHFTSEEIEKIMNRMKEEDGNDEYYTKSAKTRAENIDPSLIRYNYMYGLTVHITGMAKQNKVLKDIHQLALDKLFHEDNKSPLDDYGGWRPYRVPWITARVLICLKNADYAFRKDADEIEKVVDKALESLVNRIYQEKSWRSGVGTWVTEWESTALCLEALDTWERIPYYMSDVRKIIKYIMSNQDKWLVDPDFSTGKSSNETLSSVSLLSVVSTIIKKYFDLEEYSFEYNRMLDYYVKCIEKMDAMPDPNSSQLCTIPQIAFYIIRSLEE